MIRSTPPWVRLLIAVLGSIVALSGGQVAAQDRATGLDDDRQPPRFVDKGMGEEEQIERRREWFYGSRRDGTASADELWSLRLKGVTETKNLLRGQRDRKALGREGEQNLWVSMGPSPSNFGGWAFGTVTGRIMAIESDWDGGILYAGSASGGLWKSTNDGLSWTNIFDTAGTVSVSAITLDPVDPSILWVGTGDNVSGCESYFGIGLLRSTDGGQNWEARNGSGSSTLEDLSNFGGVTIDPRDSNKLVVGGRYRGCTTGSQNSGGIYTTTDGGVNWTNRLADTQIHELARDPNVADVLWAGTNRGIYKSSNNGVSWVLQTNSNLPNGSLSRTEIAIAPSNSNVVYALFNTPSDEFWRTTDGGATWTEMNQSACDGQCSYNMVIRVDPTNPDIIYRGTIKVFKSVNGGTTWSTLTNSWGGSQQVHQDTHSLLMHPTNSNVFYVGSDGGLWKSSTAGTSFENKNGNMNITQFYAIDVDANDPARICGGAQDNSSLATDDNVVWSLQAVSGDGFICQFNPVNTNYHYITSYPSGGYPSIWRSTNGMFGNFYGVTGAGSGIIGGDSIAWVTPYLLDPTNPSTLYVGTHRVYRSTNNGGTWTHVGPSNLAGGGQLRVIEINRNYPDVLFSGASTGVVWTTENQGTSWTDITSGLPSRAINDIAADPTNPDRAFAAVGGFNQGHVWEWNAGVGWVERNNGLPNVPANSVLMIDDMDILVGMDTGIFRSTDGGASFLPFMAGLPEGLVVMDLKLNTLQNMVSAGTYGRGVWQASLGEVQPILLSEAVEQPLLEVDGDGDDKIEPGETWGVKPILRNAGGVAALGVNARLASATPGVSILSPQLGSFGDLEPGLTLAVSTAFQFTVDPSFDCGTEIVFDLADITSAAPPGNYPTQAEIYTVAVLDENEPPVVTPVFTENFDPAPTQGWDHEPAGNAPPPCDFLPTIDEWMLASKDAGHGTSFHAGNGPGGEYGRRNYAWLHPTGKDSEGGSGILIPSDALAVSLSVVHWYDITSNQDGGNVAIDTVEDGSDSYSTLSPVGDYPSSIPTGWCNAMEGQEVFAGMSGGWITSTFDLTQFKGKRIWPAFVFGTGRRDILGEGWYIDDVKIEFLLPGAPVCDVSRWPGVVEAAQFELESGGTIMATWDDSCSLPEFPEQAYSIQVGNLDVLVSGAGYSHVPLDGDCGLLSSTSFMPGPGNEYYVIVPTGEGREGGAGMDSKNVSRPQPGTSCGVQRERCP